MEGNLTKEMGILLPDSMDDANIMSSKVFEVFHSSKFPNLSVLTEVKLWLKGLKSAFDDMTF